MTITKIATAIAETATALPSLNLTVPAGVTTSHFGVLLVGTASPTVVTMTATGWTSRVSSPTGEGNTDAHFFTRLGGVAAGNTITVNVGGGQASQMAIFACWWDTQGRDVATVGTVYTRNAATLSTVQFPGLTASASQDVLLLELDRTAGSPAISSWSPSTPTVDGYLLSADRGTLALGGGFAHFVQGGAGTSATYTATLSASGSNAVGIQLALTNPANNAPVANAGADQTVEPWTTVTLTGTDTDTENNVTTRAWSQVSGTAVTLSGSGATITFPAPPSIAGSTLTFRYTATDSGSLSGTDDVVITVLPVTERAVIGGVEVPMQVRLT